MGIERFCAAAVVDDNMTAISTFDADYLADGACFRRIDIRRLFIGNIKSHVIPNGLLADGTACRKKKLSAALLCQILGCRRTGDARLYFFRHDAAGNDEELSDGKSKIFEIDKIIKRIVHDILCFSLIFLRNSIYRIAALYLVHDSGYRRYIENLAGLQNRIFTGKVVSPSQRLL